MNKSPHIASPSCVHGADTPYDTTVRLETLFERQVEQAPLAVAVIDDQEALTYAQLDDRSGRIAAWLMARGIGKGQRIGIHLRRTNTMIAALLAVLRVGGTFVPFSAADPPQRLRRMAEQAEVTYALCDDAVSERTCQEAGILAMRLDCAEIEQMAPYRAIGRDESELTAYVIFTSGSTGTPKGVMVQHRAVVNLIEWAHRTFSFSARDRVLFVNPLSFDLSIFDIFGLLAFGGSIRIASEEERTDASYLTKLLATEPITFWNSAPAFFRLISPYLRISHHGPPRSLRLVFLSGDWIHLDLAREILTMSPPPELVALGGATEATIWSNFHVVRDIEPSWRSIPYGTPIQNVRYYILDDQLKPCEAGTAGELYIGGECLSIGYVNAPDLTETRFLADPFHERRGMRMYRSGDRARVKADGLIEFLGRLDHQVKLRGFRIELGEIEAALSSVMTADVVAILQADQTGNERIVAYVQCTDRSGSVYDDAIWARLRTLLPPYMLPSQIIALRDIPMTPNGKLDRGRLTMMDNTHQGAPGLKAANRVDLPAAADGAPDDTGFREFLLDAAIEVLNAPESILQPQSHLGDVGFTSLQYTVLSARISETYGIEVRPVALFRLQTISEVADYLLEHFPTLRAASVALEKAAPDIAGDDAVEPAHRPERRAERAASDSFAIVGLFCRMPNSANYDEYWSHLIEGRHCIQRVPSERWSWRKLYGNPLTDGDVTDIIEAGFIVGVDQFDASFFNISPREAELMDPRQRLLLQAAWHTIEDSGHRPSELRGKKVGLFVGATGDEYATLLMRAGHPIDQFSLTGTGRSFLANRISYVFDWSGPSEVIDTTCSSSLVAVHNACRAIEVGDCDLAIAGGINILIDPMPHLSLTKVGVLSRDGRCKTFDQSANGYVRGEGLGLVMIKPLGRALEDRDRIHAIIRATAINHGGKSNALTAPNSDSQADVIFEAWRKADLAPVQIGHVETHGTGTPLGDPIEVQGISQAFERLVQSSAGDATNARIALGSVKANVGHCEAAAGISGLLKMILSLKHKMIPPLLHFETQNPDIDLRGTPLVIPVKAEPWHAPAGRGGQVLRRVGGVNAFGFGGVNAHVVVEEAPARAESSRAGDAIYVLPLSARSEAALRAMAEALHDYVSRQTDELNLANLAYTYQVGRDAMAVRTALVFTSRVELEVCLSAVLAAQPGAEQAVIGHVNRERTRLAAEAGDPSRQQELAARLVASRDIPALARLWTIGLGVDWDGLYEDRDRPFQIDAPLYPFEGRSHWVASTRALTEANHLPYLRRLGVGRDGNEDFELFLAGEECFVADHVVNGVKVLPAAAYLTYAAAAHAQAHPHVPGNMIRGITWMRPISFEDDMPKRIVLQIRPKGSGTLVTFRGVEGNLPVEYCSAEVHTAPLRAVPAERAADIAALKNTMTAEFDGDQCHACLKNWEISSGPTFRGVSRLWWSDLGALALIELPRAVSHFSQRTLFHPSQIDCILQVGLLHQALAADASDLHLPFTIDRVTVHAPIPDVCYAYASRRADQGRTAQFRVYDILIFDEAGGLVTTIAGSTGIAVSRRSGAATPVHFFREQLAKVPGDVRGKVPIGRITMSKPLVIGSRGLAEHMRLRGIALAGTAELAETAEPAWSWSRALAAIDSPSINVIIEWECGGGGEAASTAPGLQAFDLIFELAKLLSANRRQPATIVICCREPQPTVESAFVEALSALGRSIRLEHPHVSTRLLVLRGDGGKSANTYDAALSGLDALLASPDQCALLFADLATGELTRPITLPMTLIDDRAAPPMVRKGGLYLITGGAGFAGQLLAEALVRDQAAVVLMGRRPAEEALTDNLQALIRSGAPVSYARADVAEVAAVARALDGARSAFGPIRGVFHCAGVRPGGLMIRKSLEEAHAVLRPKLMGLLALDEVTRDDPLDYFVAFSSLSSVSGHVGLTDYAYANRFMDIFCERRNRLQAAGLRQGAAFSISWPVWERGGMQVTASELRYIRSLGIEPLSTSAVMPILSNCLRGSPGHIICISGATNPVRDFVERISPRPGASAAHAA